MSFQLRSLAVAVATISAMPLAYGAGLDRSGQNSSAFIEQGTFAYVDYVYIDPTVKGTDTSQNKVNDFAQSHNSVNFGAKTDINDAISIGVYYDQPWGADVKHSGNSRFVSNANPNTTISETTNGAITSQTQLFQAINNAGGTTSPNAQSLTVTAGIAQVANSQAGQVTEVKVDSQNFTALVGAKLGQNKNFHVYGGPAFQKLEGEVHLRGSAYRTATGYDAHFFPSSKVGWVAGVGFSKPEIALKASLTYRSEIEHEVEIAETMPILRFQPEATASQTVKRKITTPESYNLDFQTGLNPTTLLSAKVRYVPWGDFQIVPPLYNKASKQVAPNGLALVSYKDDAWSGEIGLGKRLTPKLAVSGSVGYDSGAGNPATTLGPVKGYWNFGLGARYNLTPEWSISGGAKYLKFGNATGQLPDGTNVGEFSDNDGMIYGVRLAYQKK